MKTILKTLTMASAASLMAVAAFAADITPISHLPEKGNVSIEGRVQSLDGKNWITVKDDTGAVRVLINKDEYDSLRANDDLTITGSVKTVDGNKQVYGRSVINPMKSKDSKAESTYINDGNSTGEDMYKGNRGDKR